MRQLLVGSYAPVATSLQQGACGACAIYCLRRVCARVRVHVWVYLRVHAWVCGRARVCVGVRAVNRVECVTSDASAVGRIVCSRSYQPTTGCVWSMCDILLAPCVYACACACVGVWACACVGVFACACVGAWACARVRVRTRR